MHDNLVPTGRSPGEGEWEAELEALAPRTRRVAGPRPRRAVRAKAPRVKRTLGKPARPLRRPIARRLPRRPRGGPLIGPVRRGVAGIRRRRRWKRPGWRRRYLWRGYPLPISDSGPAPAWTVRRRRLLLVLPAVVRATVRSVDRKVGRGEVVTTSAIVSLLARRARRALTDRAYRIRLLRRDRLAAAGGEFL